MGRHSASYLAAQHAESAGPTAVGTAKYVGRVGALAFAMGVGAAVAGGVGIANADDTSSGTGNGAAGVEHSAPDSFGAKGSNALGNDEADASPGSISSVPNRTASVLVNRAAGSGPLTSPQIASRGRGQSGDVTAATTVRPEVDLTSLVPASGAAATTGLTPVPGTANPATTSGVPSPGDVAQTPFGAIGKWMLQSNGQISNYGGQPYAGKTLLEPVNVIILDPTSATPTESTVKLNRALSLSGFPAQPVHSTGFKGTIDGQTYGQQPTGLLLGYSDNLFVLPNNHGRIFGPAPVTAVDGTGYVWSGAFSTEELGVFNFLPTHTYVSSNMARTALAIALIASGQAMLVGAVPLGNAVNDATTTTGDHDGYAVVLRLN